ncbi:attractin-like protein 1 isoform X2 [Physella acuta]|uniref:attractin-like protein 1 isoform X2 n=1 Tax=Physella acuta TaxID=109671 RepID=UPI0027DE18DD|nr:attractin-like protein 1 isoform X2 [Physella acuta]
MQVELIVNEFATECVWDHLYIHNGDSAFAPVVAVYSGILLGKNKPHMKFQLTGKYVFIHFYSDAALTLPGFNISYKFTVPCASPCPDHSICVNNTCSCIQGWVGPQCENIKVECPNNCSNHGSCLNETCVCQPGFKGKYCERNNSDLNVELINSEHKNLTGRASVAFVTDDKNNLWVFGGYKFGDDNLDNNIFRFNTNNNQWTLIPDTKPYPWPRYGHSTVFYKNAFYLYGGSHGIEITRDFWRFDITNNTWEPLSSGPRNITGHTAHIVNDIMIVVFGYSSDYGYSNDVLEYSFETGNWTTVKTAGSLVQGGYGHISVYDEKSSKIYVYGGYHSNTGNANNQTDKLYRYDPTAREWFNLHNSGTPRYLHSAAIMNGLIITFGGNRHNDTRQGVQAKCFASDFMIYDIDCNVWHTVPAASLDAELEHFDRFGQAMVSLNNIIYMFGGFNSLPKKDLYKIYAGTCSLLDQTKCERVIPGIKCMWLNGSCTEDLTPSCTSKDPNESCAGYNTCQSCNNASTSDCQWCGNLCLANSSISLNCSQDSQNCTGYERDVCSFFHNCKSCQENDMCIWSSSVCVPLKATDTKRECTQKACSEYHSCDNCTNVNCMWCSNLDQCIDTNSYLVSFHYGQCMDWTTKQTSCLASSCSQQKTCSECQSNPKCGWCNNETETGIGVCFEGGMSGPIKIISGKAIPAIGKCPGQNGKNWYFNTCPVCQCNGHSKCYNETSICINCEHNTAGSQCEYCADGFYGNPQNGGQCKPCSCNGQADSCNNVSGDCFCRTRGVTGKFCERCDDSNKYSGNPKDGGTCYYQLNTDYQYTFNLSKKDDINYTQINFLNTPLSSDRDVDFTLNCTTFAYVNITYKTKLSQEEKEYTSLKPCQYIRTKFEHKNHGFGGKENTTFYVYVYNFKTPFTLQISFVQPEKINLLKFFIIFFSCFLSLLLIAAALWKIKHKYDSYRRRQQMIVEMQQMASRPFSSISVEVERKSNPAVVDKKDHLDSVLRRRKKMINKPSAISIEPLADHKAAILTLLIQLPTGDAEFAPSGQSGLAVGSALVSMGSNRKQSLEHAKGDKLKMRKNVNYYHPDTCA